MSDDYIPPRIKNDPAVIAWLESQEEFSLGDFAEYKYPSGHVTGNYHPELADMAEALRSVLPELRVDDRKLLELYLQHPPRVMAEKLGLTRRTVYKRIENAKLRALRIYSKPKKQARRPKIKDSPAPVKTLKFMLPNSTEKKLAHLVLHDGQATWTDEKGGIFPEEIQDLLAELTELSPTFTVLDVE